MEAGPRSRSEATKQHFRVLTHGVRNYAVLQLDPDGIIRSCSSGAETDRDYVADGIVGAPVAILYPAEDVAAGKPARQRAGAAERGRFEDDGLLLHADGLRFPAYIVVSVLRGDDGTLEGFLMLIRDANERRRIDVRFHQVVEAAPNAMVMVNQSGVIEMVNAQAELVFGYRRDEMLGRPIEMLVPARSRGHHPTLRDAFLQSPLPRPMGAGRELYATRKDGREFPVEIGLNPIEKDQGTMVLSAIVDLSVRKRLEERFRQVVESAPNAMVMVNQSGIIEMVNTQAERVFGYRREEMLGQTVEMLVPEGFRRTHPGLRDTFFNDPHSRPMGAGRDLYARRKDGSEFPVEIGLNPIATEEGAMVLSAIVDISDRKHREEGIQAALREKNILLGEIHHRVKNNLQIVHSLLDLQSARISDPIVLDMLRDSQNRIQSMALIHQTLYTSKDFGRVDFGLFLDSLVPMLVSSYGIDSTRIRLSIDTAQVELPIDTAVPCGLVVNELITNALRHAFNPGDQGEISVRLNHGTVDDVVLTVADSGKGLPATLDTTKTETLGLQLVTMLTDQLGGKLEINRGRPTQFALSFPIAR